MAHKQIKHEALHGQLGVSQKKKIPKGLLEEIRKTPVGKTAKNPTKTGNKKYKVTRKLKARAVFAENAKGFYGNKRGRG
jgi:hypothetical protein